MPVDLPTVITPPVVPQQQCVCGLPFGREDVFCSRCGSPAGRIEWSLAPVRAGSPILRVRPGGRFMVVAHNRGTAAVRVEVDATQSGGVRLCAGAQRRVAPGQTQSVELEQIPGEEIRGRLTLRSEDAPREVWWERRTWREVDLPLSVRVRVREERWVAGSTRLLFPPGVPVQYARIWNDAESERGLRVETPAGYRIGGGAGVRTVAAEATTELALHLDRLVPGSAADHTWCLVPDQAPVELARLPHPTVSSDADAVVAIDFGTRNTSIRVRWRRTLVPAKPAGTVDAVGDRGQSGRFPTQMVLHLREQSFFWGSEAAEYVAAQRMSVDEIAVDNLKTYLREGEERFQHLRAEWSNEELLGRYFERIVKRLDDYFQDADPGRNLTRANLRIRYVLTRPVLDANEGDAEGRSYQQALLRAMARCGVDEAAITLVQEPVAAAVGIAKRRADELLALADGTAVAVVDSGGGTTHVALGRVRLQEGRVSLDLSGSYALQLLDGNPALEAIEALERHGFEGRREVGGNVLDNVLLFRLATEAERLLESEGRPIPANIWLRPGERPKPAGSLAAQARVRDLRNIARRLKERFAKASTQYLNRAPGDPRGAGEVLPFPHREEFQGLYLVHALYDEQVLAPVLDPVVSELGERIARGGAADVRPTEVRRVFFVGGTNVDPFVRQHFGRMFPVASGDDDTQSQSDARIQERMEAVVDGAVWFDEQLYAPSPLALSVRLRGGEEPVIAAGAPLLPAGIAAPRFFVETLGPGADLEASLVASGSGLDTPMEVARALFRNDEAQPREVVLSVLVSRDQGCLAELQVGLERLPQWRFALAGTE